MDRQHELFKSELEGTREGLSNAGDSLGAAALSYLIDRYNDIFGISRPKYEVPNNIDELVDRYCYQDRNLCPICGSPVVQRRGKFGTFFGCSKFPRCRGTRSSRGTIQISSALLDFLNKATESDEVSGNTERFDSLEIG